MAKIAHFGGAKAWQKDKPLRRFRFLELDDFRSYRAPKPDCQQALNPMALHYDKRGEFGKSVDSIQSSCEKFAQIDFAQLSEAYGRKAVYHRYRLQAMMNLCTVKAAAKDFEGALDHIIPALRPALEYDEQSVFECYFMQAYYNTMLGRHEDAIRALLSAIDLLERDFLCFPTIAFHAKELPWRF
ncbi:MAG: tetratricopeptide repeat protein [Hyphomicrobiales bacterium]